MTWICELADKLRVQPETQHHSINLFDAYLMRPDIELHMKKMRHLQGKSKHDIMSLVALTSSFLSTKYLEKTYPGIVQLLQYTGLPFSYDDFIAQEKDMLETLGWKIQFISLNNILGHFQC